MDRIFIDEIVCYAYHGVLPEEVMLGQEFRISIELGIDLSDHENDLIDRVADYREAVAIVEQIMHGKSCRLIETLACRIADKLLSLPQVMETAVEVRKSNPPIPGVQGGIGILVNRRKRR